MQKKTINLIFIFMTIFLFFGCVPTARKAQLQPYQPTKVEITSTKDQTGTPKNSTLDSSNTKQTEDWR